MKRIIISLLLIIISILAVSFSWYFSKYRSPKSHLISPAKNISARLSSQLKEKASNLKDYAQLHHCNETIGFLVDMSIESGKKRFFVYDLENDSLMLSGLVAHGSCNQSWLSG
ncbi:MAG: hypothetical protein C5B52_01260 [Bacteroidetes bacterium]|nr:MAG: hypothetical protein C5B52_01260 [Bacteroidota bacterium]